MDSARLAGERVVHAVEDADRIAGDPASELALNHSDVAGMDPSVPIIG